MSKVITFLTRIKYSIDLTIFAVLFIPATVLWLITMVIRYLYRTLKNPLIMGPITFIILVYIKSDGRLTIANSIPIIKYFITRVIEEGAIVTTLIVTFIVPLTIKFFEFWCKFFKIGNPVEDLCDWCELMHLNCRLKVRDDLDRIEALR